MSVDTPQIKIATANAIKLRTACSHRREMALNLFKTEFTGVPEFLVKDGKEGDSQAHSNTRCIAELCKNCEFPKAHAYVEDLSFEIRSRAAVYQHGRKTYRDFILYILDSIAQKAMKLDVIQIDLVDEFYHDISIKSGTRDTRGRSSRELFKLPDYLPGVSQIVTLSGT